MKRVQMSLGNYKRTDGVWVNEKRTDENCPKSSTTSAL